MYLGEEMWENGAHNLRVKENKLNCPLIPLNTFYLVGENLSGVVGGPDLFGTGTKLHISA